MSDRTIRICRRCDRLDDPTDGRRCPCRSNTTTRAEVAARHAAAVELTGLNDVSGRRDDLTGRRRRHTTRARRAAA